MFTASWVLINYCLRVHLRILVIPIIYSAFIRSPSQRIAPLPIVSLRLIGFPDWKAT